VSSVNIEGLACEDLSQDVNQLAIVLYPPELFNEKFLIKLRDCVLKLKDDHPIKSWLRWVSKPRPPSPEDQKRFSFANEIVNSQFNLITDAAVRNQIIDLISEVSGTSLSENILRSYLFLMIGNISRSDTILREIIEKAPVQNWRGFHFRNSVYEKVVLDNLTTVLTKMSKHPSDRKVFELFLHYLESFSNDPILRELVSELKSGQLGGKFGLQYTAKSAPDLVHYLRLAPVSEARRVKVMRKTGWFKDQKLFYWVSPFLDIDPLISDELVKDLSILETDDQLWFTYVMDNEKLADFYAAKRGKGFIPGRRKFLQENLQKKEDYMLSLFKLLELGDINAQLVDQTVKFLVHE
jgi:hypothetical protein